ncbi:MAG: efflux RND transporter periplasmic adaptor subunit [Burkholderiales bacterium]
MRNRLARTLSLAALFVGAGTPWAGPLAVSPEQARSLQLQTAAPVPASDGGSLRLQGQVQLPPASLRVLSAPVEALVERVQVGVGDAVAARQPLLLLNSPELVGWQREHRQALLLAEQARSVAERDAKLLDEGLIPAQRAQASRHQQAAAEAALSERRQLLQLAGVVPDASLSGRAQVAAPAAGRVTEVLVQPGQRVSAGSPLLSLALPGPLWLVLQAPAEVAAQLKAGDAVQATGCDAVARIETLGAQVEGASQMRVVRAVWPRPPACVLPGQRVEATVKLSQALAGWWLPASALVRQDGKDQVYLQRPGGDERPQGRASPSPAFSYEAVPVQRLALGADGRVQVRPVAGTWGTQDRIVVQGAVALKGLAAGLAGGE